MPGSGLTHTVVVSAKVDVDDCETHAVTREENAHSIFWNLEVCWSNIHGWHRSKGVLRGGRVIGSRVNATSSVLCPGGPRPFLEADHV